MIPFADWQRSRGIRPWTEVHGWSEVRYLLRRFAERLARAFRPIVDAFRALGTAVADLARSISTSFAPFLAALGSPS